MLVHQTEGRVRILRFLPDGQRIVTANELADASMRFAIFDHVTGESIPLKLPEGDYKSLHWVMSGYPNAIAIHPSGDWLSIAWAGKLATFSTANGTLLPSPELDKITQVVISPRGDRLMASGYVTHLLKTVVAYQIGDGKAKLLWQTEMPERFHNLAGILPDGDRYVSIEEVVRIRHVDDGRELTATKHQLHGHAQPRLSRDGGLLSVLGYGNMYVADLETLAKPRKIKGSGTFGNFVSSAIHPDNGTMAVIHGGPTLLKIYSLESLDQVRVYRWKLGELCSVDFSPDGMVGAVGSKDGRILFWDVE